MCGCNSNKSTSASPAATLTSSGNFTQEQLITAPDSETQMVKLEYLGPDETYNLKSHVMREKFYRWRVTGPNREQTVFLDDAEWMLGLKQGDKPRFRVLPTSGSMELRDPAAALGMNIAG